MNDCMALMPATWIVGQTPVPGDFLSIYKIVTILVSFTGWAYVTQWVDRDTDKVKTKRERWNLIVLSGGLAGLAVRPVRLAVRTTKFGTDKGDIHG